MRRPGVAMRISHRFKRRPFASTWVLKRESGGDMTGVKAH